MLSPRYVIRKQDDSALTDAGALYELPAQVCLHTEDGELVRTLESAGLLAPLRPPYLDAAHHGIHGAYRPRPQINYFFMPPIDDVVRAIEAPLADAGYAVRDATPVVSAATSTS